MTTTRSSWPLKRIGDLATVARGSSPRPIADQRYFVDGNIPWIKIADATKSEKYLYKTKEHVNEFGASFSRKLPKGSLIVAASGVTLGHIQMLGVSGCVHDGWLYLTDFKGADKNFLFYFLKWKRDHFFKSAYGAAIQNINTEILRNTEIALPPLTLQSRIASILSAYDDLIENNIRRITILEEITQMLYREWFVHFRFPGHEKVRMVESELGPIPEGWMAGSVSEMAVLHRDGINPSDFPDELFLHFSLPSFDNNQTPVKEKGVEIKSNKYLVVPGCVLLSKLNPRIPRLWRPETGGGLRQITSTEFLVLTSSIATHRSFLLQFLGSSEFSGSLAARSLGTSTSHQRVKPDDFLALPAILPVRSVIDEFCFRVDPMMDEIAIMRSKNNNLRTTRDLLLPKLISGQVSVAASANAAPELQQEIALHA